MSKQVKPQTKINFNPLEGEFDLTSGNNFSYESVPSSKRLKIRDNEQMIVKEQFDLQGILDLEGALFLED